MEDVISIILHHSIQIIHIIIFVVAGDCGEAQVNGGSAEVEMLGANHAYKHIVRIDVDVSEILLP